MSTKFATGCLKSPIDLRDFKFKKSVSCAGNYPKSFSLERKGKVKNQKLISSCVAHALASILEYHENGKVKLSTNFIYGTRFQSNCKGMYLREACKVAYEYGDMLESDCPGNTEVNEVFSLAKEAMSDSKKVEKAKKYRIKGYVKLTNTNDIKYALMTYGPVLVALDWYSEFNLNKVTGELIFDKTSEKGSHALMLYGWDGDYWLYQNSWGPTWCGNGCFRCKDKPAEAYELIDVDNNDVVNPTHNSSTLKYTFKAINKLLNLFKK